MLYGMNLLLWTDHLQESILPVLEMLKRQGWSGVEIPLFHLDLDYASWGKRLDDLGLRRTAVTIRTSENNPISPDPKVRAAGVDATKRTLDCCHAAGVEILVGPYHSALGEFSGGAATEDEWKWGVESMRKVAEQAEQAGVTLAVEAVNRFECYFLNDMERLARFVKAVDHPRCKAMYDTFHANIEEKDPLEAIRVIAPHLTFVHISENDRSTPGHGNIPWQETLHTFKEVGYDGWLTVEAFGLALPALQAATKIWRRMYESEEQVSRDSLENLKSWVANAYGSA